MSKKSPRKKIIVAVDQSDNSRPVMAAASEVAESVNADVVVVTVIEILGVASEGELSAAQIETEEKRIAEHQKKLIDTYFSGSNLLIESKILHGEPAGKICQFAEKLNADLVVIGTRGLSKIQSKLLGSVSEKVVKNCHCSVLAVRTK
jgi:nucleotide-binding universal stress UspA family protein